MSKLDRHCQPGVPLVLLGALLAFNHASIVQAASPRLTISDNHRFLVKGDGALFFYLGDTAWELFHRLNREEADRYLENRAQKGFTVIQAVAIAKLDGHVDPNPYGHLPLVDLDPARPAVKDGPDNDYWERRITKVSRLSFAPWPAVCVKAMAETT